MKFRFQKQHIGVYIGVSRYPFKEYNCDSTFMFPSKITGRNEPNIQFHVGLVNIIKVQVLNPNPIKPGFTLQAGLKSCKFS